MQEVWKRISHHIATKTALLLYTALCHHILTTAFPAGKVKSQKKVFIYRSAKCNAGSSGQRQHKQRRRRQEINYLRKLIRGAAFVQPQEEHSSRYRLADLAVSRPAVRSFFFGVCSAILSAFFRPVCSLKWALNFPKIFNRSALLRAFGSNGSVSY